MGDKRGRTYRGLASCTPGTNADRGLLRGIALAVATGQTHFANLELKLVTPQFIAPAWSWGATLSLALLGAVMTDLAGIVASTDHRESSVIAFLVTASGMSFLSVGPGFWGIVIGMIACCVLHKRWRRPSTILITKEKQDATH